MVPKDAPETCLCRKGYTAVNILRVADADRRLVAASAHCTGRVHGAHVLGTSGLPGYFGEIGGQAKDSVLLGDSAYPVTTRLMTPITNPSTNAEREYNAGASKDSCRGQKYL